VTDKLSLYNLALGHLEERALATLTEASEPRRVLDSYYSHAVSYCQGEGLWAFMVRTVQQDPTTSFVPGAAWTVNDTPTNPPQPNGLQYAFKLPSDWVRTVIVSSSPTLDPPLTQYREEAGYLYANYQPLYYAYVSNDAQYGMNLGAWPAMFTEYVATVLARLSCKRITGSTELLKGDDGLKNMEKVARINARSKDAMNLPPGFMPQSTWVRARRGFMTMMPMSGDDGPLPAGGF
jgi:hypothetical protein